MRLEAGRPGRLRVQGELFLDHRRGLTEELGGQGQGLSESLQGSTDLTLGGSTLPTPSPPEGPPPDTIPRGLVSAGESGGHRPSATACRAVCRAADIQSCPVGRGKQSSAVVRRQVSTHDHKRLWLRAVNYAGSRGPQGRGFRSRTREEA